MIDPPRDYSIYDTSWVGPVALLISTVSDLNRFFGLLLAGEIVDESSLAQMQRTVPVTIRPRPLLRTMVEIAWSVRRLIGGHRWRPPGNIRKIKKLSHVHLGLVSLGEAGKVKSCFNQLEPCRVIGDGVRYIVLLRKRGYYEQRHPISGVHKVTIRPGV